MFQAGWVDLVTHVCVCVCAKLLELYRGPLGLSRQGGSIAACPTQRGHATIDMASGQLHVAAC